MTPTFIRFIASVERHANPDIQDQLIDLINENLPSGSGFDSGTTFDLESSTDKKLIFHTAFHHMSEHGYYTKWTEHKVTITPGFYGPEIKISGRDHNQIKDYISDVFLHLLNSTTRESIRIKHIEIVRSAQKAA